MSAGGVWHVGLAHHFDTKPVQFERDQRLRLLNKRKQSRQTLDLATREAHTFDPGGDLGEADEAIAWQVSTG